MGDLEDITDTIIKQEQQNMFIYQYISRITKEIEEAEDGNAQLKAQIEKQKEEN